MTDVAERRTGGRAGAAHREPAAGHDGVRTTLGPLWVTTFRDPVRTGRLRLDGLSRPERLLARCGLVTMVLLLASLLFGELWRRRDLLALTILDEPRFVPDGLVPVTLVAFFLAMALIVWGALDAAPVVRVTVAALYLVTVAILGFPAVFEVSDSWWLKHGGLVVRVGYWTPFAALVLSALLSLLPARVTARLRWTTAVLRVLCLLGFAAMARRPARHGPGLQRRRLPRQRAVPDPQRLHRASTGCSSRWSSSPRSRSSTSPPTSRPASPNRSARLRPGC